MPARRSTKNISTYFPFRTKRLANDGSLDRTRCSRNLSPQRPPPIVKDRQEKNDEILTHTTHLASFEKLLCETSNLGLQNKESDDCLAAPPSDSRVQTEPVYEPTQYAVEDVVASVGIEVGDAGAFKIALPRIEHDIEDEPLTVEIATPTALPAHDTPTRRRTTPKWSPFFSSTKPNPPSCLVFPSLTAKCFGLIQERLAHEPFQLLVAVIFLHQTKGSAAVPILLAFLEVFPTAELLRRTESSSIEPFIRPLGLQNKRAQLLISLAQAWSRTPPVRGSRYRYLHYPEHGSGADIPMNEQPIGENDEREAWEVAHLPGIGPYALDSWRIFCRDVLLERPFGSEPTPLANEEDVKAEMEQEWTRVLPADKELRVYLQWRWCRLRWLWDPVTGRKSRVSRELLQAMEEGKLDNHLGFDNPWQVNLGALPSLEQDLGGYHEHRSMP
jgi:hypothetical protein